MDDYVPPNGNRLGFRIIAGVSIAAMVTVTGAVFGHMLKPSHAVAKERMDHFAYMQREQTATISDIDEKLDRSLIQLGVQTAILQSIDERLDSLEP